MILEQVLKVIPRDVNVKNTVDLSQFDTGNHTLMFEILNNLKEKTFADDCRIVFYHSNPLIRDFDDLPPDILIRLQKMLCLLDIPNYFCLIVSDSEIKNDLDHVCQYYAVNETPIRYICIK